MVDVASSESLARLRALPERDAARYAGEEPTPCRRPTRPGKPDDGLLWPAGLGAMALSGLVWGLLSSNGAASVVSDVVPEPLPMRLEPQLIVPDRAPVLGANAGSVARPTDALGISRERGVWRIRADSASRHDVARTLAELSGTQLPAGIEALRSTPPLDLQWEGHDLAQAWQAVIGDEANYALKCSQTRCMAWIVAAAPAVEGRQVAKVQEAAAAPVAFASRTGRSTEVSEPSAYD